MWPPFWFLAPPSGFWPPLLLNPGDGPVPEGTFPNAMVGGLEVFKWLGCCEIHEGAFCKWCVAFAPDAVTCNAKALDLLAKSAHKNWKKAKDYKSHQTRQCHQFCAEKFGAFLELCKNEGNVDVRNMLQFFIHSYVLSLAILITSNFSFKAFASIISAPPLRKILAAPLLTPSDFHRAKCAGFPFHQ